MAVLFTMFLKRPQATKRCRCVLDKTVHMQVKSRNDEAERRYSDHKVINVQKRVLHYP